LGIAIPSPQLVGMTVLAMAAQFLAPLISLIWARQQLSHMRAVHLWDLDVADQYYHWDQAEVMRKILGAILTSLVIMNGDNRLQRMDFQKERLRTLYPENGTFWMLADALFNSWCVAACSLALFQWSGRLMTSTTLFWTCLASSSCRAWMTTRASSTTALNRRTSQELSRSAA